LIAGIQVNVDAMAGCRHEGFATATDFADYLVRKGLAFRDAHEAVARRCASPKQSGLGLEQLPPYGDAPFFAPKWKRRLPAVLTPEGSVGAGRTHRRQPRPRSACRDQGRRSSR